MLHSIIDSATGDTVGSVIIGLMDDEQILEWLCRHGYLMGAPEHYELSRTFPFADGQTVVLDMETRQPVLMIQEPEDKAA